jgi:hypothetical protein
MTENTNEVVALENMTSQERDSWRMTGVEPTREEQAEAKPEKVVEIKSKPEAEEAEVVAATEPEETESGTVTKTEEQKTRKPGQMSYKELRTRIADLEKQIAAGTTKPAAADAEAAKADAKVDAKDAKPRPKSTDKKADGSPKYQTWEEYEDDLLSWREEKLRATVKEDSTKAQQDAKKQELESQVQQIVKNRADEARKKYSDFDAKVMDKDLPIAEGSVLYNWIMDPENAAGMDIAYHFGSNRDKLAEFTKLSPFAQARELTRLEDKLSTTTTNTPEKDVKVVSHEKAPIKVTKAPPPAREIGGRGSAGGDEETSAVNNGEFRTYSKVVNAKETAHLRATRK